MGKHRIRKFNGHSGAVYCIDCDAYRIVSGSADATIRVWNIRTNAKWSVQTLRGHSDAVRCVQLLSLPHYQSNNNNNNNIDGYCSSPPVHCIHESIASIPCSLCKLDTTVTYPNCWEPPEVLLISGSADTTLKLWRLSATSNWSRIACTCTLQGHTDTVRCVQNMFSENNQQFIPTVKFNFKTIVLECVNFNMPPNALVRPRVGRVRSPSQNALAWPRIHSLCQRSPTHCLVVAWVLFEKFRGRKANARRSNRIPNQWCTWAPVPQGNKWRMNQSLVTGYHGTASPHDAPLPCGSDL
ncbi:unnamed protein product [Schistosoma mattheei]|uniref:Uncharacterized protein n=1 Tax=Schistosoma mattheei TaxID=31246 RepID=A0A3P8FJS0_9TREM|nr:unnamed protein product [Schistosoma mattheei]